MLRQSFLADRAPRISKEEREAIRDAKIRKSKKKRMQVRVWKKQQDVKKKRRLYRREMATKLGRKLNRVVEPEAEQQDEEVEMEPEFELKPGEVFAEPEWAVPAFTTKAYLSVTKHALGAAQTVPIVEKKMYLLGRAKGNDIILPHETCSEQHAALIWSTEGLCLVDLFSQGCTFINGEPVTPGMTMLLHAGDILQFAGLIKQYKLMGYDDPHPLNGWLLLLMMLSSPLS